MAGSEAEISRAHGTWLPGGERDRDRWRNQKCDQKGGKKEPGGEGV